MVENDMSQPKRNQSQATWLLLLLAIVSGAMGPAGLVAAQYPLRHPGEAASRHISTGSGKTATADAEYAPGQVVVKYRDITEGQRLLSDTARWGTRIGGQIPPLDAVLLQVPAGSESAVIAQLELDPLVEYAELNYKAHALEEPNDPQRPQQWALSRVSAPQAWDIAHCQGTVVAVLDTGVFLEHPDLRSILWTNPGEVPGNGIDDDGNSKIDDIYGWHFYQDCDTDTCQPLEDSVIDDDHGHGTHIAGIAAADTDNGIGIAGISWGARAMVVKVLDEEGEGYYYDIAQGMQYAADHGAQVINLSLGGEPSSQLLQDAADYAHQRGVLLVAAAGNDGGQVLYPARYDTVMAVAATDNEDQRVRFSNHGAEVDIAAPGVGILSTWPWLDGYHSKRGTSMAAAHVSGAAALLWSWLPVLTNEQVQRRLESHADDVNEETYPGRDHYLGWGRLNVYRAIAGLPPGPIATPTPTIYRYYLLLPLFMTSYSG